MNDTISFRPAAPEDDRLLAQLLDISNAGADCREIKKTLPPGADWIEVVTSRIADPANEVHRGNAVIALAGGEPAGMMIMNPLAQDVPVPSDPNDINRAFYQLRLHATGSLYLRNIAVLPQMRRRGIAHALLQVFHEIARTAEVPVLSAIVHEDNAPMIALLTSAGYANHHYEVLDNYPAYRPDSRILLFEFNLNKARPGA